MISPRYNDIQTLIKTIEKSKNHSGCWTVNTLFEKNIPSNTP